MKSKKFLALALAAISVGTMAAFASCGEGGTSTGGGDSTDGTTITITGSSSVSPLMQELAAAYMEDHDVVINVETSDSGTGIRDTQNGRNDIGMASRDLKDTETGVVSKQIATDGVALIVGTGCTVSDVTAAEVYDLYASGTPIKNVINAGINREPSSGTRGAFTELIKKEGHALDELDTFASCITEQNSTEAVKTTIAGSTTVMSYISLGSLDDTVKALKFEGVEATVENVADGSYTLSRPFNIVYKSEDSLSDAAKAFIDFIMSEEGQTIVEDKGYIKM